MDSLNPLYLGPHPMGGHRVQLPDGSMLQVSTAALTPHLIGQAMSKLPHYDTGGVVDPPPPAPAPFNPDAAMANAASGAGNFILNAVTGGLGKQPGAPPPAAPAPQVAAPAQSAPAEVAPIPTPVRAQAPTGIGGGGGGSSEREIEASKASGIDAAKQQAAVDTDIGKGKADAQTKANAAQNAEALKFQQQRDQDRQTGLDMLAKAQALTDEARNQKLEGPQKTSLLSGLALIFGGGAAGFQGQANPVVKQLADRQQADLERQKYNMDHGLAVSKQYQSLYSDYRNVGLDDQHAHELTENTMKSQLENQLTAVTLQHAGPQAAATMAKQISDVQGNTATKHAAILKDAADAFQARAAGAKDVAEVQNLGLQGAQADALRTATANINRGVPGHALPPDQKSAIFNNAQKNEMTIGNDIAGRKVTADDHQKDQDINVLNDSLAHLDQIAGDPTKYKEAKSYAQTAKILIPKLLGAQSRLNLGAQDAVDNMMAENPAGFVRYQAMAGALHNTVGSVQDAFDKDLQRVRMNAPLKKTKPAQNG